MQPVPILLIGAQKAGSSYLFRLIAQDNSFAVAQLAEPKIFSKPMYSQSEFVSHFHIQSHHKFILDGSTSYLHVVGTAERAASVLGTDIPILVTLRDPSERMISGYLHEVKHGRELRTPCDAFNLPFDLASAITAENESINAAWERGLVQPQNQVNERYYDPIFGFRYVANSYYSRHLAPWFSLFPNIRLIEFKDLCAEPDKVITQVRAWLGLPNRNQFSVDHPRNSTVLRLLSAIRENRALEYDYVRPSLVDVWKRQRRLFRRIRAEKPKAPLKLAELLEQDFISLKSETIDKWLKF